MKLFFNTVSNELTLKLLIKIVNETETINEVIVVKSGNQEFNFNRKIKLVELDYEKLILSESSDIIDLNSHDQNDINYLKKYSLEILFMMNRIHRLFSYSFDSRYFMLIRYFKIASSIVNQYKPDIFLFTNMPHEIYDYSLYKLAEFKRIKKYFLKTGSQIDTYYQILETIEGNDSDLAYYENENSEINHPEIKNILKRYQDPDYTFFYMNPNFKPIKRRYYGINFLYFKLKNLTNILTKSVSTGYLHNYVFESLIMYNIDTYRVKRLLKKNTTRNLDTNKKIIYVPLHYQPELTTSPMGGKFYDQLEMIDLLNRKLPSNFIIYIKEHPKQRLNFGRSYFFYKRLFQFDKVKFIDRKISSNKVFEISEIISTVTGTVGFQALCSGKPVMVFGEPFYMHFERAFKIRTEDDINLFFNNYYKNDFNQKQLNKFLNKCEKCFHYGYVDSDYQHLSKYNIDKNVDNIVKNLQPKLKL